MAGKTAGALVQNKGSGTNVCELIIVFFTTKHIKRKEKPVSPKDVHFYKVVEMVIFIESTHDMCFFNILCDKVELHVKHFCCMLKYSICL